MEHSLKQINQYLAMYPNLQKWVNLCPICGARGRRPDMPDEIGSMNGKVSAHTLKRMLPVLEVDQNGICLSCSRLYYQQKRK